MMAGILIALTFTVAYAMGQSPRDVDFWHGVLELSNLMPLITIFTVIVAADAVAGEFTAGTIKLLLIRPASRSKILFSKYAASFLFTLLMLFILFAASLLASLAMFGLPGPTEGKPLAELLQGYGLKLVELVMIVTLAFMLSTVFRGSSMAIGFSIFIMFASGAITMLIARLWWGKYWLFAHTDLTQHLRGMPIIPDGTLGFSIAVLAAYFVIFNTLSWFVFTKRDVAA